MSGLDVNTGSGTGASRDDDEGNEAPETPLRSRDEGPRAEREGLPREYRMRADAHYVEQLAARSSGQPIRLIAVDEIDVSARGDGVAAALDPLTHSIRVHGVLHPLLVQRRGVRYGLIAGRKRLEAARLAGLSAVPCVIHHVEDDEAARLAEADNLVIGAPKQPEQAVDFIAAARTSIAEHLGSVQTSARLLASASVARRAAADMTHMHAWRAARLFDVLAAAEHDRVRPVRRRTVQSIVDDLVEGFAPEARLTGVRLQAKVSDPAASVTTDYDDLFVSLVAGVLATVPMVEHEDDPVVAIRVTQGEGATLVDVAQGSVRVPPVVARRFFDDAFCERPGGWIGVLAARAIAQIAKRRGGRAVFELAGSGAGVLRITLPQEKV